MNRLDGKVAIVTGGVQGIGRAVALRCTAEGAAVVIGDLQDDSSTADQIVADVDAAFALFARCFGTVHHLINNAGTASLSLVEDCSEDEWDLIVDTLLKGAFLCTRAFARQATKGGEGASIVNISSLNAVAATLMGAA